jgi:hypothetical protein
MVQFQNPWDGKLFIGSYANIGCNKGGNMIKRKYLIISIVIVLFTVTMVGPALAAPTYSVSISSYGNGAISSPISSQKLSLLNDYISQKSVVSTGFPGLELNSGKTSALTNLKSQSSLPSVGTVSAFSKFSQKGNNSVMEFSDSVSMSGDIFLFEYTFSFL